MSKSWTKYLSNSQGKQRTLPKTRKDEKTFHLTMRQIAAGNSDTSRFPPTSGCWGDSNTATARLQEAVYREREVAD